MWHESYRTAPEIQLCVTPLRLGFSALMLMVPLAIMSAKEWIRRMKCERKATSNADPTSETSRESFLPSRLRETNPRPGAAAEGLSLDAQIVASDAHSTNRWLINRCVSMPFVKKPLAPASSMAWGPSVLE
jgi:hypothetical protein